MSLVAARAVPALFALALLGMASGAAGQGGAAVSLERAPGELGEFRADGLVAMDVSQDGKELVLLPLTRSLKHFGGVEGLALAEP